MQITEVRIKLMEDAGERLQAFCSITFDDCFVIRDLKIIEGTSGPFVAMPSRKLTGHCPQCGSKNHLRAGYCNQCGARLKEPSLAKDDDGRAKLYADIAHPINSACREMIQEKVIKAFYEEIEHSKQPGYVSSYDDWDDEVLAGLKQRRDTAHRPPAPAVISPHQSQTQAKVDTGGGEPRAPHIGTAQQRQPAAGATNSAAPSAVPSPHLPTTNSSEQRTADQRSTEQRSAEQRKSGFGAGIL